MSQPIKILIYLAIIGTILSLIIQFPKILKTGLTLNSLVDVISLLLAIPFWIIIMRRWDMSFKFQKMTCPKCAFEGKGEIKSVGHPILIVLVWLLSGIMPVIAIPLMLYFIFYAKNTYSCPTCKLEIEKI